MEKVWKSVLTNDFLYSNYDSETNLYVIKKRELLLNFITIMSFDNEAEVKKYLNELGYFEVDKYFNFIDYPLLHKS